MPQYLRRAFSRAHSEQVDSMVSYEKFHGVLFEERPSICGAPALETVGIQKLQTVFCRKDCLFKFLFKN